MNPMATLMAATRNVARAFKVDKDLGTLEPGKFADLLILDKNPLEDAANYRSISLVMKEGHIVDRNALPTQRLLTVPLQSNCDRAPGHA
jgi:imidazolonepropionase-like amidohydrolase